MSDDDDKVTAKKRERTGPGDEDDEDDDKAPDSSPDADDDDDDDDDDAAAKPGADADDDEPDTATEFRHLYTDAKEAEARFRKLAEESEKAGDHTTATIYREVTGNVLSILSDLIATGGQAIVAVEDKADALDDARDESFLTEEDAERYLAQFTSTLKIVEDILSGQLPSDQREALERFKKATLELIEYTKSITE